MSSREYERGRRDASHGVPSKPPHDGFFENAFGRNQKEQEEYQDYKDGREAGKIEHEKRERK